MPSMSLCCSCVQTLDQNQELEEAYGTLLRKTKRVVNRLGLYELFTDQAGAEDYWSAFDFLLCRVYPEQEKPCRTYYQGKGKQLRRLHTAAEIRNMDETVALCVFTSFKYAKEAKEDVAKGEES